MRHHAVHSSRSSTGWPVAGRIAARRFTAGPNHRKGASLWPAADRLTIALCVGLLLALWWLYRTVTAQERPAPLPAAPEVPQIQFRISPPQKRLDPSRSA